MNVNFLPKETRIRLIQSSNYPIGVYIKEELGFRLLSEFTEIYNISFGEEDLIEYQILYQPKEELKTMEDVFRRVLSEFFKPLEK